MDGVTADDVRASRGLEMMVSRGPRPGAEPRRSGLELGRRQDLLVLEEGKERPELVRVVDHGETQKEAVRRLFDAEVILRSYEEQLEAQEAQLRAYEALLQKEGRMPQDRDVGKAAQKEERKAQVMGAEAAKLLAEQADMAQLRREQKHQEEAPVDYDARKVPYWLRNDERSRRSVEALRARIMRQYADEGQITNVGLLEQLWHCGLDFALRWGGRVAEEVVKQGEEAEARSRATRRDAVREASALRQHIRNVEFRHTELLEEAKKLQRQLRDATGRPKPAEVAAQAAALEEKLAAGFPELPLERARDMAAQILAGWLTPREEAAAAAPVVDVSRYEQLPREGELEWRGLEQDADIAALPEQAALEQMDHELFEPLQMFDGDMRELLIDVVNEKVRRILTLDASRYEHGRLPFGLRPDGHGSLVEELERLRGLVLRLREELELATRERDQLRGRLEAMESRRPLPPPPVVEDACCNTEEDLLEELIRSEVERRLPDALEARLAEELELRVPPEVERRVAERVEEELARRLPEELEKCLEEARRELLEKIGSLEATVEELQALLAARETEVVKEVVKEEVEVVVERFTGASVEELEAAREELRRARELMKELLSELAPDGDDTDLEAWAEEGLQRLVALTPRRAKAHTTQRGTSPPPQPPPPPPPPPQDSEETLRLRQLCKSQEEEIARLLLLVDELRKRLEAMGDQAQLEPGSPLAASLEQFGLKEVATAKQPHKLHGVFLRLYEDALQRIARYAMIRERMLAANQLSGSLLSVLGQSQHAGADLERLNATASAALKGMAYSTEYLLKGTLEYALRQGVENTLFRVKRGAEEAEDTEQPEENRQMQRQSGRLPWRKALRSASHSPNSSTSEKQAPAMLRPEPEHWKEHWKAQPQAALLAPKLQKRALGDLRKPEEASLEHVKPAAFGQYFSALRDQEEEAKDWPRERAGSPPRLATPSKRPLAASQSLPALPKSRGAGGRIWLPLTSASRLPLTSAPPPEAPAREAPAAQEAAGVAPNSPFRPAPAALARLPASRLPPHLRSPPLA